ncbi:MAG: CesT family type III secretion system chaperone [Desulfovibrionaceae bacterium]|nr:CesT family type III secretion system chaperone [Desulfovibrionaceae bacterium]
MIINDHDSLLSELGDKLELNLTFDDDRNCEIVLDNDYCIIIHSADDDGIIIISTVIKNKILDDVGYNTLLDILDSAASAYLQGGNVPVIGYDEESGFTILYQVCTASYLAQNKLIDILTSFIQYFKNI